MIGKRVLEIPVYRLSPQAYTVETDQLRGNAAARAIFRLLLATGVGQIFYVADIIRGLPGSMPPPEAEKAINRLVELDLLTQTGVHNDVLFFKDLQFAHTLSVIALNPSAYGFHPREFAPLSQLSLPLEDT